MVGRLYRAGRGEAQVQISGTRPMSQGPLMSSPPPAVRPGLTHKESSNPIKSISFHSMLGQFEQKFRTADLVKCLAKFKQDKVYLLTFYKFPVEVFNKLNKLCIYFP